MTDAASEADTHAPTEDEFGGAVYLDVGAVRIQSYLGRSRHLWGRRGASALLAGRSRGAAVTELLAATPSGVEVRPNPEAPEVDGVVSVIVTPGSAVEQVARHVSRALGDELPGLHLEARAAAAPTYIEAYTRMRDAGPLLEWLPGLFEYPPGKRCDECGIDAVVRTLTIGGKPVHACADCAARREGPSRQRSAVRRPGALVGTFTVEHRLMEAMDAGASEDFDGLAALSSVERGNHLVTIAADGNSLGSLFGAARERLATRRKDGRRPEDDRPGVGTAHLRELSSRVTETTWEALLAATRAVFDPQQHPLLPVVPHVLGGDDVLVSLPADCAWRFVEALLAGFRGGSEPARALAAIATGLEVPVPTLSAGVVISHSSLPFGQQVSLAEDLLHDAKGRVAGAGFSVAWLDTTWDGAQPVRGRRPMTLDELTAARTGLTALAGIGASARQVLAREIDTPDVEYAQRRVRSRLARQHDEVANAVRTYLGARGANLLAATWNAEELVRVLRDGLSLARWWR